MNEIDKRIGRGSTHLYAYLYNGEGCSPAIEIQLDLKQIASFLIRTSNTRKATIRNHLDEVELSTLPGSDGFVVHCSDEKFLAELQPTVLLMQHGEMESEEVTVYSWGVPKETLEFVKGEAGMRTWLNEMFNTNL